MYPPVIHLHINSLKCDVATKFLRHHLFKIHECFWVFFRCRWAVKTFDSFLQKTSGGAHVYDHWHFGKNLVKHLPFCLREGSYLSVCVQTIAQWKRADGDKDLWVCLCLCGIKSSHSDQYSEWICCHYLHSPTCYPAVVGQRIWENVSKPSRRTVIPITNVHPLAPAIIYCERVIRL